MRRLIVASTALAAVLAGISAANAGTIDWATWTQLTTRYPTGGSASGATSGGVTITYGGELLSVIANYPSWMPTSSYVGGTVGNAPPQIWRTFTVTRRSC